MQRFFIILFILSFFTINNLYSQTIVKGVVYDVSGSKPLEGVHVIYGPNDGTVTNMSGEYSFITEPGSLLITFKFLGYTTLNKTIDVIENRSLVLNVTLQESINELEEIVISADKNEHKVSESTISMEILKPKSITQNHITNAGDIIKQSSGIEILDGQASIRGGSGYSYGAGSRVLVLIDGLPVLSTDAGDVKWHFLPLENLSRLEIIKGASSVLYGSSALNGIINLITADPGLDPQTKYSVSGGIYDNPNRKSWDWSETPRMFSSASFFHSRKIGNTDMSIGSNLFYDQGYRKLNDSKWGRLNFKLKHYSKKYKSLSYGLSLNSMMVEKRDFLLWENAYNGGLIQNESTAMLFNGFILTVDPYISINKNNRIKHDLKARYQSTINKLPDNEENNSNANSFYTEYKFWYRIIDNLNLTLGAAQQASNITSNFYNNHKGFNIAGYTQINYRPIERLKLIGGIRLEQNSLDGLKDPFKPILRAGINYQAFKYTFIRASYGQGYRYPSVAEKHAYTTVGAIKIYPNSEIRPETGWSAELGIKQGMDIGGWKGQVDMAVFYSQNTDLIEYVFGLYPNLLTEEFDFGFMASNLENSRVTGAELEFMASKNIGEIALNLITGYTYINPVEINAVTKVSTGRYLKYRSKHSAKIILNTEYKKWGIGLNFFYKSKMLNIDNVFLNPSTREDFLPGFFTYWNNNNTGYFITDINLTYNFNIHSSISVAVKNLLNEEYMGRPGDIQAQRSFSLQYSRQF